ncbi:DUF499 domain-containing protein [Qipengyuania aurantiaca]|uniref:DUF499 domain-containing protein n=1 Tax=Qipengyuania aurantiaca TaxID=2867233 RepID=A0ABX8ZNA8_9SPHN|nr:DUF499 domain-containing protein [Qipengyuania aurantiaca]QZD88668.1 DUF499 domain-containing protein [Qipengyuania aurantiaca]
MAKSTRQYVFDGMELLPDALTPFVEKRLESSIQGHWQPEIAKRVVGLKVSKEGDIIWDQAALLKTIMYQWKEAFAAVLGHPERSYVSELLDVRHKLAHNETFTYDDAERALDTMRRLMEAISAGEAAAEIAKMRETILRTKYAELQRNEERRKTQRLNISVETVAGLLPWREVVEPHQDVATGEFQQAEFAADLGKVHAGSAPSEYSNPKEFFSRTYLTDGLSTLLVGAAKRLSQNGGDPVVELQTNFGGGKTHSMLALYHMVGETPAQDLPGLDQLLSKSELTVPSKVNRAVLVGTSRGPQDVLKVAGGREIRTTWGELAWQLGGAEAFDMVADNDANGIAPGSNLLEAIFKKCAPCLILIDEWVAYLRQIYKVEGLPSGSFDANLSFVQSLTEAVKASPGTLLVASLPASQIEVGGEGGQEALARLKQTFSRVESSWRPASQEESYEIVRRRLFKEIPGDRHHHKDNTLKQFAKLYRENSNDFPQGCSDEDYRRKLEKAYPIHPELFDQLYTSWGSLEKFQRTRGVLRLMAQVIHELWMSNDPSVMIMPGSVAISSSRVEPELLHYLDVNWQSIIAGDVDGASSTPYKIDQSAPNLNRYSATRRVARAVFMGSAPTYQEENRGLDDKQINLGVVQPGERPAIFGDALRRLTNQAKFMHSDLGRYWYSMSASLNRLAADRAGQLEDALILVTIDQELTKYVNGIADRGHFDAVQVAPASSSEVPDEAGGVRAVVLGVSHAHNGREGSDAQVEAKDILMQRGSTPRVYRNTLVFLSAEARQLDGLKDAVRSALAWESIVKDDKRLDLKKSDIALAEAKLAEAKDTMKTRLRECWCYLIYPHQEDAQSDVEWSSSKIPAQDGLLSRASKKLASDEGLLPELGPTRLDRDLQRYIWNGKPHLLLRDLWEYLNRYTYLPRLKDQTVLVKAVQAAVSGMLPGPFAYAEKWDENGESYLGLLIDKASSPHIVVDRDSVLIKPDVAEAHRPTPTNPGETSSEEGTPGSESGPTTQDEEQTTTTESSEKEKLPTRFNGTVMISPDRPARDIHQIVEAIVEQLTTIPGSEVSLKLEIDAEVASGLDRSKVRTLMENAATLGFIDKDIR